MLFNKLMENNEPVIKNGNTMFYSQTCVDTKYGIQCYKNVVLIYNVDGINVPTTHNAPSLSDAVKFLKVYPDLEKLFVMDENSNQKYIGTRCCGEVNSKRCDNIILSGNTEKYCPGCRENMKAYLG